MVKGANGLLYMVRRGETEEGDRRWIVLPFGVHPSMRFRLFMSILDRNLTPQAFYKKGNDSHLQGSPQRGIDESIGKGRDV